MYGERNNLLDYLDTFVNFMIYHVFPNRIFKDDDKKLLANLVDIKGDVTKGEN